MDRCPWLAVLTGMGSILFAIMMVFSQSALAAETGLPAPESFEPGIVRGSEVLARCGSSYREALVMNRVGTNAVAVRFLTREDNAECTGVRQNREGAALDYFPFSQIPEIRRGVPFVDERIYRTGDAVTARCGFMEYDARIFRMVRGELVDVVFADESVQAACGGQFRELDEVVVPDLTMAKGAVQEISKAVWDPRKNAAFTTHAFALQLSPSARAL